MSQEWTERLNNVIGNVGLLMNPIPNAFNAPDLGRVYNELGNFLSGGRLNDALAGVDRPRLNNASRIAENNYQSAVGNLQNSNQFQNSNQTQNSNQFQNSNQTQSDLDKMIGLINMIRGNGNPSDSGRTSTQDYLNFFKEMSPMVAQQGRDALTLKSNLNQSEMRLDNQLGQSDMRLKADIDKETAYRQQGFNVQNATLANQFTTEQKKLDSNIRIGEGREVFGQNMAYKNQDFENNKYLNAQQRKFTSSDNLISTLGNLYAQGIPRNDLSFRVSS